YEQDISAIRSEVKKINLEDMNNLAAIERNFTAVKNVYDTSDNLYKDFLQIKGELEGDLSSLRTLKEEIPVWIKADYNNAVSLAKLPDVSVQNVALMLFGDKITSGIIQLLDYLEKSREIAAQKSSEKVKGPEKQPHLPKFWIQNAQLSLETNNKMILSGQVTDISTDQDRTGKPLVLNFKGAKDNLGRINLGATFDYRDLKSRENINLMINEVPIRNFELANFDLLPTRLEKGSAMLISNINLTEELIYANLDFAASDLEFDYNSLPEMNEQLVRIARSISEAIDEVNFQAEVTQNKETFKFKLNSNLDNIIAAQLKNVISGEINRAKAELQAKVQKELDKYRAELDVFIDQKSALIQDKFDQVNQQIDEQKSQITAKQKEIEDRIEAEKQKIKNQAEDKLKEEAEKLLEKLKS
ncbi:MAG: hypothetical protein JW996_01245, partial [Candidatus Cloacimonetes bacterium]|nr:hypothetical protein [Candidatus Cloacimonadota bacterium]